MSLILTHCNDRKPKTQALIDRFCQQRLRCCNARSFARARNGKPWTSSSNRGRSRESIANIIPATSDAASRDCNRRRRANGESGQRPARGRLRRVPIFKGRGPSTKPFSLPYRQRKSCGGKIPFSGHQPAKSPAGTAAKKSIITSTIPQEGKSTVSANLACTLAKRTQQRTLLLEGDVRRPSLSQLFGLGRVSGICECLQGEHSLLTSIYHLRVRASGFYQRAALRSTRWNSCNQDDCRQRWIS